MSDLFIGFMVGTAFLGCAIFIWQAYIELGKPGILPRLKAWWKAFVKRHIVDDDPYDSKDGHE